MNVQYSHRNNTFLDNMLIEHFISRSVIQNIRRSLLYKTNINRNRMTLTSANLSSVGRELITLLVIRQRDFFQEFLRIAE